VVEIVLDDSEREFLGALARRRVLLMARGLTNKEIEGHVAGEVVTGKQVHPILDNYCTHKSATVLRWLVKRPHWHLHFTPTHASWLNQVERFFAKITTEAIRRGNFLSAGDLVPAIHAYPDAHNAGPRPFVWEATASFKRPPNYAN